MKKAWLSRKVRGLFKLASTMRPLSVALVAIGAMALVVLGTFGIWQLQQLVAPDTGLQERGGASAQLRSSDNDAAGNPLANNLTDTTVPQYGDLGVTFVGELSSGGTIPFARLQGEVRYHD